jgi:hypothetical protein
MTRNIALLLGLLVAGPAFGQTQYAPCSYSSEEAVVVGKEKDQLSGTFLAAPVAGYFPGKDRNFFILRTQQGLCQARVPSWDYDNYNVGDKYRQ